MNYFFLIEHFYLQNPLDAWTNLSENDGPTGALTTEIATLERVLELNPADGIAREGLRRARMALGFDAFAHNVDIQRDQKCEREQVENGFLKKNC